MMKSEHSMHQSSTTRSTWSRAWKLAAGIALAATLAACGDSDPLLKRIVVFGDSLSDMGTYQVGNVKALGGGKFTVNPGPMWNEIVATELESKITVGMAGGFGVAPTICPAQDNSCTNWAQGGARVTQRPGIGFAVDGSASLATPISEQIAAHLTRVGGTFDNRDVVSIQGGANDIFYQLGVLQFLLDNGTPLEQAATTVVTAMATAGAELAELVKAELLANGAKQVVVWNIPDVSDTPFGKFVLDAPTRGLVSQMTLAFNSALTAGLTGATVRTIDSKALIATWAASPNAYGFTDVEQRACSGDKIAAATGGLVTDGSSLFCTELTLLDTDTSRFMFADGVHPTPYTHKLMAQTFMNELRAAGWR
jgi:outer membrane lipase/esterase